MRTKWSITLGISVLWKASNSIQRTHGAAATGRVSQGIYDAAMTEANRRDQGAAYPWREMVQQWSPLWLAADRDETERRFPGSAHETQWLCYGGATEAQTTELERLLGTTLLPSYRQFLVVTDGWIHVDDTEGPLLPTTAIGWLKDTDPGCVATCDEEPAGVPPITDSEYFVYGEYGECGEVQDLVTVRREHRRTERISPSTAAPTSHRPAR